MNGELLDKAGLDILPDLLISLGVGLLIGLERERNPASRAGLRTFGLVGSFGAICALLAGQLASPWIIAAGLLIVGAMMIAAYRMHPDEVDPGTTSVVALLLCFAYGAMITLGYREPAVIMAILTTLLLYFKPELQSLSRSMTRADLNSILQFAVLSLVILPILPNKDMGPYAALNPAQIWWMVVLISGVSLCGYAALRFFGQQRGAPLLGFFGGLASSTATTLIFSRHARSQAGLAPLALVVILIANMIVPLRLGMLTAVVQPGALPAVLPVLGGGLLAGAIISFVAWRQLGSRDGLPELELRNPTELRTAITFGLVYGVVLLCSAALSDYAGTAGLYVVALISGLTDVDAITLSSLHLFGQDKLSAGEAATAILIAMLANLGFKLGIISVVGGRALMRGALAGFLGLAGGSLAGWVLLRIL
ncbi:MgtC/SapB family protein [Rhodocyclus tenuis]|uniref:Uncharacterized membrane protein (DUF4010 family) n=1 Tax=Rhodocyclus tenuis TaxID=1066 RepID=A0A840GHP3_RHOTE|nr:MgtC/SapB family protein [Rhodocyclus tenuis]MBB4248002.1 uncharacterized membrane protein (DUF4010 family) [Rhodocyclus tenuis]